VQSESQEHAYVVRSKENQDEYAKLSQRIAREGSREEWKDGESHQEVKERLERAAFFALAESKLTSGAISISIS
jgi:hypothetical protein